MIDLANVLLMVLSVLLSGGNLVALPSEVVAQIDAVLGTRQEDACGCDHKSDVIQLIQGAEVVGEASVAKEASMIGEAGVVKEDSTLEAVETEVRYSFEDYFEQVEWIVRDGVVSLSIYPSAYLLEWSEEEEAKGIASFLCLVERYGEDDAWQNTEAMKAQYLCHQRLARGFKVPWNIEPHRTECDLQQTISAMCNP